MTNKNTRKNMPKFFELNNVFFDKLTARKQISFNYERLRLNRN